MKIKLSPWNLESAKESDIGVGQIKAVQSLWLGERLVIAVVIWSCHMTRSTFFCQKKVLFFAKKKYFFLQKKVLLFAKKSTFFCKKKYLFLVIKTHFMPSNALLWEPQSHHQGSVAYLVVLSSKWPPRQPGCHHLRRSGRSRHCHCCTFKKRCTD